MFEHRNPLSGLPLPSALALALALALTLAGPAAGQEAFPGVARSPLGAKPEATVFGEQHVPGLVELKLVHGSDARLEEGRLTGAAPGLAELDAVLDGLGATRERLWLEDDATLVAWRRAAEARSGRPLHDLTQFFHLRLPGEVSVAAVCDLLNSFELVELARPVGTGGDPVVVLAPPAALGTPDYVSLQQYRAPAPLGIDAEYGNTFSHGVGEGTLIADCETGWTDDHEDIRDAAEGQYVGFPPQHYPWSHGTAVLGELVGQDNGFGVLGIVHAAGVRMSTHQGDPAKFPAAIQAAVSAVGVGDAVVIEIQCFSAAPGPHPCEYEASIYSVVETATAAGVHVFAAAGNGNNDLDQPAYGGLFDRDVRDSGAVLVGASDGAALDKASFSNYGSRLDAHGWGWNVATAGYGDLQGGPATQQYTATFSGTSSATPIVTGAGMILESIHRGAYGVPLDPLVLRDALTQTGTPQGSGGQIGPRPDLRAAVPFLGLPHIEVVGPLTPGSDYRVIQRGKPGDLHVISFSLTLQQQPTTIAPYGQLFLAQPITRVLTGALDANGTAVYSDSIPADPLLVGTTIGHYQGWQRFQSDPGTGTFTNHIPITVQ